MLELTICMTVVSGDHEPRGGNAPVSSKGGDADGGEI